MRADKTVGNEKTLVKGRRPGDGRGNQQPHLAAGGPLSRKGARGRQCCVPQVIHITTSFSVKCSAVGDGNREGGYLSVLVVRKLNTSEDVRKTKGRSCAQQSRPS